MPQQFTTICYKLRSHWIWGMVQRSQPRAKYPLIPREKLHFLLIVQMMITERKDRHELLFLVFPPQKFLHFLLIVRMMITERKDRHELLFLVLPPQLSPN